MPFLVNQGTNTMSSKFDSIPVNIPPADKRAEENIYFNTDETFGGEYCDLDHNPPLFAQARHPSTSGNGNQERDPNAQNLRVGNSERAKRHKKVALQDAAGCNGERLPVTSTNRGRARLASDSQVVTHSSRYPARMTDIHTRNAPSKSTFQTQPSITSERSRRVPEVRPSRHSYLNRGISEDLSGNGQNTVITDQPRPGGMVLMERREEQEKHRPLTDTWENLMSDPRTVLRNDSKNELENKQDFTRNRISKEPHARNTRADRLDLNMNRAKAQAREPNGKRENGRERVARPTIHKQSSREERLANNSGQREEVRTDNRGEKRPQISSVVSSLKPPRHPGIMDRNTNDITRRDDKTRRREDIEMTNMAPVSNPRIQQLRREETPAKHPLLGLAFPRPHSFDVPENKTKVSKTFSSPELRGSSLDELLGDDNDNKRSEGSKDVGVRNKNDEHNNRSSNQAMNNSSKAVVKIKGIRSKSLPVSGNTRNSSSAGRRGQAVEASPLRYFAYLGKRFQFRERLLSAHNVLSARPVILTSTSFISPEVTTNFCQQLENQDSEPRDDSVKHQGACQDLIDCCTCMCCVKALFYHCTKDDESEGHYAEHPCSCSGPEGSCVCRWSVLGILSLVMPCILCYLPVLGCTLGVEYCRRKPSTPDSSEQ